MFISMVNLNLIFRTLVLDFLKKQSPLVLDFLKKQSRF